VIKQKLRVLHLHSTFNPGGKELRCVQLINAFGLGVAHTIVSAVAGAMEATDCAGDRMGRGARFSQFAGAAHAKALGRTGAGDGGV